MKKRTILVFLLAVLLLAGCSQQPVVDEAEENRFTFATIPPPSIRETTETQATQPQETQSGTTSGSVVSGSVVQSSSGDMRYVMIYNPTIYDNEYFLNNVFLNTGDFSSQIDVSMARGGGDEELETPKTDVSQEEINSGIPYEEFDTEGDRAGSVQKTYRVGDTETFYRYPNTSLDDSRISQKFTCRYVGTYCNIWCADNSLSDATIKTYGKDFDSYVYPQVTKTFGTARFTDKGGKVNLLFYDMPDGVGGCFCMLDLYATGEVTSAQVSRYGINLDHAILHMNTQFLERSDMQIFSHGVMAHEFQHMICATNVFETVNFDVCPTWLNEAMSGYIEELLYPGSKEQGGHIYSFHNSYLVSHGQSLYHFLTFSGLDIGAYGSVYLFSEYLADLAGEDVFSNLHSYWRTSYSSTLSDAEAIRNSVSGYPQWKIDKSITYPSSLKFDNEDEQWLSKLVLNFYLELFSIDSDDPAAFSQISRESLLYDEVNPTDIEGGGRIVFALNGNSYTIPADADPGLIYVGLDENFQVVTDFVYH